MPIKKELVKGFRRLASNPLREVRRVIGTLTADPSDKDKIKQLQKQVEYLYRFLDLPPGERQMALDLSDIRKDHLGRYEFAAAKISPKMRVIDAACGVGYGSFLLAKSGAVVTGVDISKGAITSANQFYKHENNNFIQRDCAATQLAHASFDYAVSFETIEHINHASAFVAHLFELLKPGGTLICSTPNEEQWKFSQSKHPFHVRHYAPDEIRALLEDAGFVALDFFTQMSDSDQTVSPGQSGRFLIICAQKPD